MKLLSTNSKGWSASAVLHTIVLGTLVAAPLGTQRTEQPIEFTTSSMDAIEITITESPEQTIEFESSELKVEVAPTEARIGEREYIQDFDTDMVFDDSSIDADILRSVSVAKKQNVEPPRMTTAPHSPLRERQLIRPEAATAISQPSSKTTLPIFQNNRPPSYPQVAIDNRWEGVVTLRVHIDEAGIVREVEVIAGSGYDVLDGAAVNAVSTWQATPATEFGRNVSTKVKLPVRFQLPK